MTRQLAPIDIISPGNLGLNTAQSRTILSPQFAVTATNAVIDEAGRLAARKGWSDQTTTDISGNPSIQTLHEYRKQDGTTEFIVAWDGGIANNIADPEGNDISGSVTDSNGRWNFNNFNNKCIGFQSGQKPIVYTGSGNFATVVESSGTAPDGGVGLCAFGRVWCLDSDGKTVKYSGLLDETDWGGAGAGSIDTSSVWTDGTDEVKALAAFNNFLLFFGRRHIIVWEDGSGSTIGIDPTNLQVRDIIEGTGCVSELTIHATGETDLLYLSPHGVQSIRRIILEKSNPISTLTKNVRQELLNDLYTEPEEDIRATFNPNEGFYLLTFPGEGVTWCIDQRRRFRDQEGDEVARVTTWALAPTAWLTTDEDFDLYLGNTDGIGIYGNLTDNGDQFTFTWKSPWIDLGEELANRLKHLKRLGQILAMSNNGDVTVTWGVDFSDDAKSIDETINNAAASEWGSAEFGTSEWGGGTTFIVKYDIPARASGRYFQISSSVAVEGPFALQQLELVFKLGRIA